MTQQNTNSARYCDGKSRQFCVRFPGAGIDGDRWAAVGGQTCLDPLDCVALTEDEAKAAGEAWARRRTTVIGADLSRLYRVEPLPAGWSNDGAPPPAADISAYEVDRAESIHGLGRKSDDELRTLAAHFRTVAPHATVASNRQSSEAIVAACERLIARRGAMVPQPCQPQQANAGAHIEPGLVLSLARTATAFHHADEAWDAALRAAFGRRATDARYSALGQGEPGSELRALYVARYQAYAAWSAARSLPVMPDPVAGMLTVKAVA